MFSTPFDISKINIIEDRSIIEKVIQQITVFKLIFEKTVAFCLLELFLINIMALGFF